MSWVISRVELIVSSVRNLRASALNISSVPVKGVTNTMSQNPSPVASDTASVPDATFQFDPSLGAYAGVSSTSIKCPVCKVPTPHDWFKVMPFALKPVDPMETLKLSKRVVLCSQCGSLRMTN